MTKVLLRVTGSAGLACLLALGAIAIVDSGGPHHLLIQWAQSAPFPEPTAGYAAGVIKNDLVISGGTYWLGTKHNWVKKLFSAATYRFQPATQQWQKLPDAPIALGYAAGTVVGDKLFVLGGFTGEKVNRNIYTFQGIHGQYIWKKFGELPVDRVFAAAVTIGKDIYLLGGSTEFEPTDALGTCCTSNTASNSLMVLDTGHPERGWRELASYPGPRRLFFTAETDGKSIWLFGGQFQSKLKQPIVNFDEVLRFDTGRGEWKLAAHLPEALKNTPFVSPVYSQNRMILISSVKEVWEFDLETSKFKESTPLPKEAAVDKFVSVGGRLIGSGGESPEEPPRRRSDWTFIGEVLHE